MLFGILMWIVISLVPLQTSPEFVVHEIEACCHHRISLKCSGDEHMKIVVVQARYVIDQEEQIPATASSSHPHYPYPASRQNGTIVLSPPSSSSSATDNLPRSRNPRTISIWDLDTKFANDLVQENLPHPVHVNAPPWHPSHISHHEDKQRFHYRRVTVPPPFDKDGLNFTSTRVIEMPPYQLKFLDKETIWREPLFSIGESESSIMSSDSYVPYKKVGSGSGVGKRSHHPEPFSNEQQVPSTETNTESGTYDYGEQGGGEPRILVKSNHRGILRISEDILIQDAVGKATVRLSLFVGTNQTLTLQNYATCYLKAK